MAFNENHASIIPDATKELAWGTAPAIWDKEVKDIFLAAKKNPYVAFFEQSDIAVFRAILNFHARSMRTMVEPNAAVFKAIFDKYDAFNLTIRGRVNSGLTIAPKSEIAISEESQEMLANSIMSIIDARRETAPDEVGEEHAESPA